MKVLFADSNHDILHETLINSGFECDLFWNKSSEELISILPNYDALVIRSKFKITKEIMDNCPNLKCIGRVGAGMENIDVAYAALKKIICVSAPEGNRDALGEHAIAMLLMLFTNLKKADAEVRKGIWLRAENRGFEIKDKTIGIIGYGKMGSAFAKKLTGFDCTVLVYDKYLSGFGNGQITETTMDKLFDECDIVSLHVPLTKETEFMVDNTFINKFKKDIYIINTSRGKNLRTADLVTALKNGKVKGACLDVLEYESVSFEQIENKEIPDPLNYLINSDKVILSPHIGGWTHESNFKMSKIIAEKMIAALKN
ncbi:MAG: NAD(P)-dependent oxidoreductase [Bacteroidota bacterium]|nr:NAD(P)-dependent oxidoreductase [Bacteroidota bacterium]